MSFKEWRDWQKAIPWSLRWFVYLVFLRPFVDRFYDLKTISPFLSPLYIVGALTPMLCLVALFRFRKKDTIVSDRFFNFLAVIVIIAGIFTFLINGFDIYSLMVFFKILTPVLLFPFCRILIRSKEDLHGILQTFLYSSIIVIFIFFYEMIFGGLNIEYTRTDIARYQGGFADLMNYAFYITLGFASICYFYLIKRAKKTATFRSILLVVLVGALCIAALSKISHLTSYFVFAGLLGLLCYELFRASRRILILIGILLFVGYTLFGDQLYKSNIEPLISRDLEVVGGERAETQLFHGRLGRWENMLTDFKGYPVFVQLFGVPFNLTDPFLTSLEITGGAHNDFLRILFNAGIIGLILYILFLLNIVFRLRYLKLPEHFLLAGILIIFLLYSVTTLPTMYSQMLYIVFTVFSYASLKKGYLKEN